LNEVQVLGVLLAANAFLAALHLLLYLHQGTVSGKTQGKNVWR
jgi:hypothetical protein